MGGTPTFFDFAVLAFSEAVVPRGGSQQSAEVREEETGCTLKICALGSKCTLSCEERKQRERKKERKRKKRDLIHAHTCTCTHMLRERVKEREREGGRREENKKGEKMQEREREREIEKSMVET